MRNRKVAPAPCSCTATKKSIRRPQPPLVLLPVRSSQNTFSSTKNPSDDPFIPKYASTGISDEDLENTQPCITTDSTTLYISASSGEQPKLFIAKAIEMTDGTAQSQTSPDIVPDDDTPVNFLTYSTTSIDVLRVVSGQSRKSTLGRFLNKNLTRGRTFLRKMRKPRTLPTSPAVKNERAAMKRSLPSMPGSFGY